MPHISVEYSSNLEDRADIPGLCEVLRRTAAALEVFPETGVRVRAFRADHYAIADGDPENGFVDISVRLREGRAQDVKEAATAALFDAVKTHLAALIAARPVMVSMEMRDIDARLAPKLNTVTAYIEGKRAHG
ncbi:MAG: 5-carboxymethyl-2-hydroxymuconate Delta-isomerase [Rhodobacter sp.]|nr:5-carboxymethyl-2-hydroxymuconate Delta-isomerase [Rhodobacter sp.]